MVLNMAQHSGRQPARQRVASVHALDSPLASRLPALHSLPGPSRPCSPCVDCSCSLPCWAWQSTASDPSVHRLIQASDCFLYALLHSTCPPCICPRSQSALLDMAKHSDLFAHQLIWALQTEEQPPQEAFNPEVKR